MIPFKVVKNQAPIAQSPVPAKIIKQTTEPARDQKLIGELKSIIKNSVETKNQLRVDKNQADQVYEPPRVVTTTTLIEGCRDRKLTGRFFK